MLYPSIKEYIESINNASENLDKLSYLSPVRNENGEVIMSSGNFAVVFKMQDREGKQYALKCFLREQEGRSESYSKIIDELEFISSPYMVKMEYFDNELFVDSNTSSESEFPVLLMDWVDGVTIDRYVRENIYYQYALDMLCYDFCKLSSWLMSQPFAHGNLKPDNILVKDDGSLVLVDYDGMYVPSMQGEHSRELGSPDYRHPLRSVEVFNSNIDDYALALISLTLKLISKNPKYIQEKDGNEGLLFNENDFRDLSDSIIPEYVSEYLSDPEVVKLYSLFLMCHSYGDLSLTSFRLFKLQRPQMPEYLELSTVVTDDDLVNCITDEYGVKYSRDGLRLLKCENKDLRSYKIRRGCRVICNSAFCDSTLLESIVIPNSVTTIGKCFMGSFVSLVGFSKIGAFDGCTSLKSIEIPNSVIEIGNEAFKNCTSLQSIVIPNSVTDLGSDVFNGCISLKSIVLPNTYASSSFENCCSLESIVIPNSVLFIGSFEGCTSLKSIVLPDSLMYGASINGFFNGCTSLESIVIPDGVIEIGENAFLDCISLKSIVIPESVTEIGENAFYGCTSLESVVIPESVTEIGCGAFGGCTSLESVVIPESVTEIGSGAFYGCTSLKSIVIPESVTEIDYAAFDGCTSLESVVIPESVTKIGYAAFSGCTSLESMVIPESVTEIGEYAFSGCTSLESVVIPESVTEIGEYTFKGCTSLESVVIPESVTKIGYAAFSGCTSLESVIIPESVTEIGSLAFLGYTSLENIYIPKGSTGKFKEMLDYNLWDKLIEV